MPKISFVMPTKNRANLIGESIQTILDQTFEDWELVIIDDHSLDDTMAVVEKFKDPRIKYFNLPDRNGTGSSCARNFGNMLATSEIILVADSDDLNYPERAQVTYQYFVNHPQTDFFYAHADVWEMEKNFRRERRIPFTPFNIEKLKEVDFIPHPTVAYKKQVILEIPYNPIFIFAEDYDLISRFVLNKKNIGYLNQKLVTQRFHPGRLSQDRITQEKCAQLVRVLRGWDKSMGAAELIKGITK